MLVGAPGAKKTFLAIDLAVCVAMGKPWLGKPVRQGPVIFVDEQIGPHALKSRFNAALQAHGAGPETPLYFTSLANYNLRENESANNFTDFVESWQPSIVIIDSFSNLLQGANESSLGAVLPVLFSLRMLAEFNHAAVLVTHHTNRHGVFQGSSAISASMDLILAVESAPSETLIQIQPAKSRFVAPPPFSARAHFDTAQDGTNRFFLSHEDQAPTAATQIVKIPSGVTGLAFTLFMNSFRHFDQLTFKQLRDRHQGDPEGSIRNAVQQLMDEGVIVRVDGGNQGAEAFYSLARPP
jgi:predicted ATP-dependent serine protease